MIGLIPCRKGSKRLPGKALIDLNGKPLLYYTLKAAENSILDNYYLTSDYTLMDLDDAGLDLSEFGRLRFLRRPEEICRDESLYTEYIWHFLGNCDLQLDSVCLLQPTCPLRTSKDINEAVDIYQHGSLPGLVSGFEIPKGLLYNSNFTSIFGTEYIKGECAFVRNSAIYIFSVPYFINHKSIFANPTHTYVMDVMDSVDINNQNDLEICKKLLIGEVK